MSRRRLGDNFESSTDAHIKSTLIDDNLTPDAKAGVSRVQMSLIDRLGRRAVASFLRDEQYNKIAYRRDRLTARLVLESLPNFIHANGGQICYIIRLGNCNEVLNAVMEVVNVCGVNRNILLEGFMFIQFEDEQVVISVDCNHDGSLEITVRSSMDSASFWDRWNEYAEKNNYLHGNAFFADGEIIERTKKMTWDNIFLAEETKRLVKTHVCNFIENRDRLKLCGVKARRGLILSGVPGTGKSLLGKVLADTLDISFMWVLPRHIKNSESFAAIMSVARLTAPTVLFFEDIDLYAEDRNTAGWGGLGELMNQLDGCRENTDIITIASTNRLEVVEKALQNRPGRFDRIVEVGHMDEICCRKFLAKLLSDASICSEDFEYAVAQLNECTGAQIEEFSNTLYILAVERNPTRGPGSQAGGPVVLDRIIIDLALGELKFEKKRRLGFNVA